jgi:hypothetical protein
MVVAKYEAMNLYQSMDSWLPWGRRIRINRCLRAIWRCSMYTMSNTVLTSEQARDRRLCHEQ